MISMLTGRVAEKDVENTIIDVNGVGYSVLLSIRTLEKLPPKGETVKLLIHTHVREDAFVLFGFLEKTEKRLFELITSVSGIGPKTALGMLSQVAPADFVTRVLMNDKAGPTSVPGVGKKTAERIILELREKVKNYDWGDKCDSLIAGDESHIERTKAADGMLVDAIGALVGLGYRESTARDIAETALRKLGDDAGLEDVIRESLRTGV